MPARPTPQCCPPQRHGPTVDRARHRCRMPDAGAGAGSGSGSRLRLQAPSWPAAWAVAGARVNVQCPIPVSGSGTDCRCPEPRPVSGWSVPRRMGKEVRPGYLPPSGHCPVMIVQREDSWSDSRCSIFRWHGRAPGAGWGWQPRWPARCYWAGAPPISAPRSRPTTSRNRPCRG